MHSLNVYYGCALTCRYAIPAALRGAQAEEALKAHFERAVALAVLDHPLLQAGLVGESTKDPVWVRLERLDLRHHIQWQTISCNSDKSLSNSGRMMNAVLEDTIMAQHDTPYPDLETRPGWKMVVLCAPDLNYVEAFFGINHANADGESAKMFQQTLLEKLNLTSTSSLSAPDDALSGLQLEGHVLTLPPMPQSAFTPAHETLVGLSVSPVWAVSVVLNQILPSWLRSHPLRNLEWAPQRAVPVRTALRLIEIDAEALRRVLDACRRHDTTLTGVVQAMVVTSLAMRTRTHTTTTRPGALPSKKTLPTSPSPIVLGTPVSMHRYIRPNAAAAAQNPERIMVNSVTYCFHHYYGRRLASLYDLAGNVAQDNDEANHERGCLADNAEINARRLEAALWEQAARVRRQLTEKLSKGTHNDLTGLLKFVPDFRGRMAEEMAVADRPRDVTVEVSNLGVMNGEVISRPKLPLQAEVDGSSVASLAAEKEGVEDFGDVAAATSRGDHDDQDQKWIIERAMFTQSGIPHGVALLVNAIAVKGKRLTVSVNWQSGLIDEEVAAGLARDLEVWLGSLGRGDHISFSNRAKSG